jgi:hypothetical protein
MTLWLLAALGGVLAALLQYGRSALAPRVLPLALLRALAAAIVIALLLGAPVGRGRAPVAEVALDASESWLRGAPGCTAWSAALDSAFRLSGGQPLRFGESLRASADRGAPTDRASGLRAVADRASGTGRPVVVITDGEPDDAELLSSLPRGSRAIVLPCAPAPDVAVSALDAPRALLSGDTLAATVTLVAGGVGGPAGRLELRLDDALVSAADVSSAAPFAERTVVLRGTAGGGERAGVLRAVFHGAGDQEPRNDTLALGVDVTRAPGAVFVSTAPDFDAREAVAALRGVTSLPTRAYYRVAPGAWRTDGALAHVEERVVREAVREAPMVVLHGDTSVFGPPRDATRGSLLLFAPPADEGEWFVAAAPASPLAAALSGLPLDSLPPVAVSPSLPRAEWQGLVARRGGAPDDRRPLLVGWETPRRVAVLGASGLWRWRFRGGRRADSYGTVFGALYDWLAAGRSDRRAVVPDGGAVRAGAPLRWRRGAPSDSVAVVRLARRSGGPPSGDSVTVRFAEGASVAESPGLAPGVYDLRMPGGTGVLAVNASRELVPRRPTVRGGAIGGAAAAGAALSVREMGWIYALAVLLLCAEWLLRRKQGLR